MINLRIHGPMESPLSHQQLLTSIPSSFPTSSNGFFIEIHENITKVAFFIEDDIWALEHDVCNLQSFIFCGLGKDLNQRYISPEIFKDSSVDRTRHYFGPTRKIYVYSGTFKSIFHSHGSYVHLRQPTSKGSCMRKPVSRIP